jgi:hypothetical protein
MQKCPHSGRTVMNSDPQFEKLISRVGKELNIKPHIVAKKTLTAPGDIEGRFQYSLS